ncbi:MULTISPECIES: hypothetical protein [unclassified Massilia]|uniref:hypothetical protein n=1 Tax=unclassified Massilia TaxID=2609279 RepID=UPI00177D8121|nr:MULTISPECIES: hypothetical protein [unclassified Massilia]MBD8531505.1 hypothetical protein [Massilia sp. CFBP 13647]MBD8673699.1 hypothetical protein [Massilia sp. CFBP 13721]
MHDQIDSFQRKLTTYFRQMTLGFVFADLGKLVENPGEIAIRLTLSKKATSEPIPLNDFIPHSGEVSAGVAELFQVRAIAAWNDLLNDLFSVFVREHLTGSRQFKAIKKRSASVDFSSSEPIQDQILRSVVTDFTFDPYKARIKSIKDLCITKLPVDDDLKIIRKHVEIRNNFQHHGGVVTQDLLDNLGSNKLELLNSTAQAFELKKGDRILLYIPELNLLKAAMYRVTIKWRNANADLPA